MAITWRTMNQPIAAGVGQLLYGAQQGLNQGFGALQKVLDQHNQTQQANWANEKKNNTADYLDAVQNIQDPAQLQDSATQANLAALRQQFGYQVDANAIRGATEKRASDLQVQATNNLKFADLNQEHDQRPLVEEFYRLKNNGDFKGAQGLLDANGFLNEGALSDSLKSGQYKAADESRAVAGEGRAQASFSLNQARGKEDLAWARESRQMVREERQQEKAADKLLSDTIYTYNTQRTQAEQTLNSLAKDAGVNIVNGVLDLNGVPEETKTKLEAAIDKAGIGNLDSSTALRKQFEDTLRARNVPESKIAGYVKNFEAGVERSNTLAPQDQVELDTQLAAVEKAKTYAKEDQLKQFNELKKNNQFLVGVDDPNLTIDDITSTIKANNFSPAGSDDGNRDDLIELVSKISTQGFDIGDKNYKIPPPMLKQALAMSSDDWFNPDNGVKEVLIKMITSNPKAYADSITAIEDQKKALRDIDTQAIKQTSRLTNEFKSGKRIPVDVTKLQKTLNKERY